MSESLEELKERVEKIEEEGEGKAQVEISAMIYGQELTVVGGPDDDLKAVSAMWSKKLNEVMDAYNDLSETDASSLADVQ